MRRFIVASLLWSVPLLPSLMAEANAQGFSTLKAAGQGMSGSSSDDDEKKSKKSTIDKSYRNAGPIGDAAGLNDIVFLGVFETYLTRQRQNARISLFVEPKKFGLVHRACKKITKVRDGVNTHLFLNPPQIDDRGRVLTNGMSQGIHEAIKQALKTKVDYFEKLHVIPGRFSVERPPKDLKSQAISDCEGVKVKAKEIDGV